MNDGNEGQGTAAPGAATPPPKKKRTLPAALAAYKFQKGHKRGKKPATQAASPEPTTPAASRRSVGVIGWLWS